MQCIQCQTEYEPKRKTSKYCSPQCRLKHHRGQDSVAINGDSVAKEDESSVSKAVNETLKVESETQDGVSVAPKVIQTVPKWAGNDPDLEFPPFDTSFCNKHRIMRGHCPCTRPQQPQGR